MKKKMTMALTTKKRKMIKAIIPSLKKRLKVEKKKIKERVSLMTKRKECASIKSIIGVELQTITWIDSKERIRDRSMLNIPEKQPKEEKTNKCTQEPMIQNCIL